MIEGIQCPLFYLLYVHMNTNPEQIQGKYNTLYVGNPAEQWTSAMMKEWPGTLFFKLQDAINACPRGDGETTFGYNGTTIVIHSQHLEVTESVTIPVECSGITIKGLPGSYLGTNKDLGEDGSILIIEGHNITLEGLTFWNISEDQKGNAVTIGGVKGRGIRTIFKDCYFPEEEPYKPFANPIKTNNTKFTILKDCLLKGEITTKLL